MSPLTGTGVTGTLNVAWAISAGASSVTTSPAIPSTFRGWIAFDPYTSSCDFAQITSISGTTVSFLPSTASSHASGAPIALFETPEVTPQLFGAIANGINNDRPAIQAAVNSVAGVVLFPLGDYRVTTGITVSAAKLLKGVGTAGAGITTFVDGGGSPGGIPLTAIIDHDYADSQGAGCTSGCTDSNPLFNVTGESGYVQPSAGGGFENLILRQAHGSGTSHQGTAIQYVASSSSYWSTWNHIRNVNIEVMSGADDWAYGIYMDGSGTAGPSSGQGQRDTWIENCRIESGANALGGLYGTDVANLYVSNTLFNSTTNAVVTLTGPSSTNQSSGIEMTDVSANVLSLGNVNNAVLHGGNIVSISQISGTTSTDCDLEPGSLSNAPTITAGSNNVSAGVYTPTGQPTTWAAAGMQLNVSTIGIQNGTSVSLGTTDNNALILMTNSTERAKLDTAGNLFIFADGGALILRSPDGYCWALTVANGGVLSAPTSVTCP